MGHPSCATSRWRSAGAQLSSCPSGGAVMAAGARRCLKIFAVGTMLLCGGWAAAGLLFRFAAYGAMPVAPGEPYGEGDVLELFHYGALLAFCGLAVLQGLVLLVLGRFDLRRLATFMCLFGLALPLVYRRLHSWIAALAAQ